MHDAVTGFLRSSHTCLLLVHPEVRRLEDVADELSSGYGWPHLPVGRALSAALLAGPPGRRPSEARRWTKARLGEMAPGPVLCTGIDLLFEPGLELDPLRLLCDAGRLTRLVVAWPGDYQDGILSYAVPAHGHYRTWRRPDVAIAVVTSR